MAQRAAILACDMWESYMQISSAWSWHAVRYSTRGGGANVAANKTTDHAIKAVVCTAGSRWQMVDGG
jgi:hypothetical protein